MNIPQKLTIASRESALAMWQAEHIQAKLQALYPSCTVDILGMTTQGDQILDKTLSKIGGKGLFIKELETALQENRADLAVHSLKDVPMDLPEGFVLVAVGERANPFDALVSNRCERLEELPEGAVVGTSSLRREAQLRARFPHLQVKPLRGNVWPTWTTAIMTRLFWRPPAWNVCSCTAASAACCRRPTACRRRGRAHWASKLPRTAPIWWTSFCRSTMRKPPPALPPSVRWHGRWAAAAKCRWARIARQTNTAC